MQHLACQRNPAEGVRIVRRPSLCLALGLLCFLVAHSAAAQTRSLPPAGTSGVALHGVMIPTGFEGQNYSAMIQIAVDGSPLPGATWDLGASLVSEGREPESFSGRVVAEEPGAKVVLEFQVEFKPGPYTLTLTARETTAGQSGTRKLEGHWPDPGEQRATVSPVVFLQPAKGAFVRGKNARGQGALALEDADAIRAQLPTAVVSVVCRGAVTLDPVRVERRLAGVASADFKTFELLPGQRRCAQVRDMIAPGILQEGLKYEVRLATETGEIASGGREFVTIVGTPGSQPGP